jgi:hypothetical protein
MPEWIGDLASILEMIFSGHSEDASEESHMPVAEIQDLPDSARTWVFGADRDLDESATDLLLREVDRFISQWHAHGAPLTAARDWKHGRFLTVAVDQSTAGASGCSIDGLFRALKSLEPRLGASLVTSGLLFFRDPRGRIESVDREQFAELSAKGTIGPDTRVFDPTVTTLGEWRARFELNAGESWHAKLLEKNQPA